MSLSLLSASVLWASAAWHPLPPPLAEATPPISAGLSPAPVFPAPLFSILLAAAEPAPVTPPPSPAPAPGVRPEVQTQVTTIQVEVLPPLPFADPAQLLRALERAHEPLTSLRARIRYDRTFAIAGDRQVRTGEWFYEDRRADGRGARTTAVRFDTLRIGDRLEDDPQIFIFDGQSLIEKQVRSKQLIRRRLTQEGQRIDPLSVDGPLPVPISQRTEDVLRRFDAQLLGPEEGLEAPEPDEQGALLRAVAGLVQLRLTLKPEFERDVDIREVRLWYRPRPEPSAGNAEASEMGVEPLPRLVRAENRAGDISFVELIQARENQPVPPEIMDPTAPPGWKVDDR